MEADESFSQCHGVLPSNKARNSPLLGRGKPSRMVCMGSVMLDMEPCNKFSLASMSLCWRKSKNGDVLNWYKGIYIFLTNILIYID